MLFSNFCKTQIKNQTTQTMKQTIITGCLFLSAISTFAQSQDKPMDVKYRRSSLHTMVIESESFPNKEVVLKAFNTAPFPEKYNEHTIGQKSFNPANFTLSSEELDSIYKPKGKGMLSQIASSLLVDSAKKEMPYKIQKYFDNEKVANKIVSKWFNRQSDGSFDFNLVADRGVFNASFLETKSAQASSDGLALLKTTGLELIGNTFVVVNKFKFYPNEPVAAIIRDLAKAQVAQSLAGKPQFLIDKANKGLDAVYEKTKEGYTIIATSFLYKLVWNDSISTVFFTDMYMEKGGVDAKKKALFDNTDLFKLEFVGDETASSLVTFSLKEKRTEEQVITLSTTRIIDRVYAKLQKKYDVFKTKTPLYTGYPITAKIGVKEGLEGGEKFEVLEQNIDEKTGAATYKSIGTIKVDKNLVWDNTYTDGQAPAEEVVPEATATETEKGKGKKGKEKKPKPILDRTTFKGGKKYYSGLLIKQIK
jgi:hypothetical protein